MVTLLALGSVLTARADHPPGATIPDAAVVDVSDAGLQAFLPIAGSLIPAEIDIPNIDLQGFDEECFIFCVTLYEYDIHTDNGWVAVSLDNVDLTPINASAGVARLDVSATIGARVNQSSDPLLLDIDASAIGLGVDETDCRAWVDPFQIQVNGSITLSIVQGPDGPALDATIAGLDNWTWTLTGDAVNLTDCGTISTIEDILGFVGVDIYDIILDFAEPEIRSAISDLTSDLEGPIEDAFASAVIHEELDLAGVPLVIDVFPSAIESTSAGIRLHLDGSIDAPSHECVAQYGIEASLATPSTLDPIGFQPPGLAFSPHVAVQADDDLLNQGLFALWNAGLLCQTIDDTFEGLPLAIDTTLLGLVAPGVYDDLFPEAAPLKIQTRPTLPPTGSTVGAYDLNIAVDGLGVDLVAELDGRQARVLALDLAVDAGADVVFDGTTGNLAVEVALSGDNLTPTVSFNELTPEANTQIEAQFLGLFDSLAGPLLGGVLDDLAFAIPSFEGFGLATAEVRAAASAGDRLGVYGSVAAVPYQSAGCDGGGCDAGSGCGDTSCSTGGVPGRALLLAFPVVLAGLRRRHRPTDD